jgi:hypothetical protein
MFTGELRHSWVAHAGGVTALIEAWGPDRIVTDFDLILFITHYGAIVTTHSVNNSITADLTLRPCLPSSRGKTVS